MDTISLSILFSEALSLGQQVLLLACSKVVPGPTSDMSVSMYNGLVSP